MKVNNSAALNAPKVLVFLKSSVIASGLAGTFYLKSRSDSNQGLQGPIDCIQRNRAHFLAYLFENLFSRRVVERFYQRFINGYSLRSYLEAIAFAPPLELI